MSLVDSGNPMMSALVLPLCFPGQEHLFLKARSSDLSREILIVSSDCTETIGLASSG